MLNNENRVKRIATRSGAIRVWGKGVGVVRIFDWGGGKPRITCNDVIRKFPMRNFLWGKDIVEWKIRSRGLVVT